MYLTNKNRLQSTVLSSGWSFISIAVLLVGIFAIYPVFRSLVLSTMSGKGTVYSFVGLGNLQRLFFDPIFLAAVKNTFIYLIFQVPIMLMLALIMSSILNFANLKFAGFFRTAIFLPCVTSLVAYSVLFKSMFSTDGLINSILFGLRIVDSPIAWFTDPFWAKVTIILAITWRWTGYNMVFYLAGLQNIRTEIYEAAEIDGASNIRKFFAITLPMLKPIIVFTSIMSTIGTLQLFDDVVNLIGYNLSTVTLSQYIYDLCFKYVPNFGYAATVAYVIVFFIAILSAIQFKLTRE